MREVTYLITLDDRGKDQRLNLGSGCVEMVTVKCYCLVTTGHMVVTLYNLSSIEHSVR